MTSQTAEPELVGSELGAGWCLTGCLPGHLSPTSTPVTKFPFVVGRDVACDLSLSSRNVSKRHAEVLATTGATLIRDLGSTNGTFVNGRRITDAVPIGDQDLVQFADVELRFCRLTYIAADFTQVADQLEQTWLISRMHEVLNEQRLTMLFQPILAGAQPTIVAYEALARTDVPGLELPFRLFEAATRMGLEERLSRECRQLAVRDFRRSGASGALFLNTHPHEELGAELIDSLSDLRAAAGECPLVIEIHEEAVPDLSRLRSFRDSLRELEIGLAYDDFGAGQSRLRELAEAPPDYLKFDRSLVKDLGNPTAIHTELVRTLHQHAVQLGIATVAEGVETAETLQACRELGFTHFQGYLFGQPSRLTATPSSSRA